MRLRSHSPTARWLSIASLLLIAACPSGERSVVGPEFAISDGAHSGGTAGFYFLPPMVADPAVTGIFDGDIARVNPAVAICDVTEGPDVDCGGSSPGATPALRLFTVTSSPAITVGSDKYRVNWDTKESGFNAGRTYRVHVFMGPDGSRRELGFADVLLTDRPGQVRNLAEGELITLNDGRTLPIHFHIAQGIVVGPGDARRFDLTDLPASVRAGALSSLTVTARDQNGNVATGYRGTIAISSSDPEATLPANYTFTEADAGVHTFAGAIAFATAGSVTLRVADVSDAALFAEITIAVDPSDAVSLHVTGLDDPTEAGTIGSMIVTARDAHGNIAAGYEGTIAFTSTDARATLPGNYTFTAADAGVHAFAGSVTLRTAGSTTVTATDVAVATMSDAQTVTVTPADAVELLLSGTPDHVTAGVASDLTVTARDAFENIATGYAGTVQFTSSDAAATLPASYTFTAADAGVRAFPASVTLRTAGSTTVTVTDVAVATLSDAQTVTVTPAAAVALLVSGVPGHVTAGVASDLTVTARDAHGNIAAGYEGTIAFTSTDPRATLPGNYTFTAADGGVRNFPASVTLRTAGSATVTATDVAVATLSDAQTVTVTPAAAVELLLSGVPGHVTAGVAYDLTVTARDAFENIATGYAGTVQFTSNDAAATLPASYAFQTGDAGVKTFTAGVTFETAGSRSLAATDAAVPGIDGSVSFIVDAGAAAELRFTTQPSDALSDAPIAPPVVVTAYDAFGNVASGFSGQVTITIGANPGSATLSGTLNRTAALGVASFADLRIDEGGVGYTLVASATGIASATSEPFDVTVPVITEVHWINPSGGAWNVGANWNTGTVPTPEQTAHIDLAGTYTVVLDVSPTVRGLVVGASSGTQTLSVGSRVLTVVTSGSIGTNGVLALSNGTVGGPGSVTNDGTTRTVSSTIATAFINSGLLVVTGFSQATGSFANAADGTVQVQGNGTVGFGTLTVSAGFTNSGTIELTNATPSSGWGATLTVNSGTLTNAAGGIIRSLPGGGGSRSLNAQLDNQGTITLGHPLTISRTSADHTNSGLIDVSGGNLTVTQSGTSPSFTNTGTVTVAEARTWSVTSGAFTQAAGAVLNGGGAVTLTSVSPAAFATDFDLGALTLSSTTASFTADLSTGAVALTVLNSTVNGPGVVTNPASHTLILTSSTVNTAVTNSGTLVVRGFSAITGAFANEAGATLQMEGNGTQGGATLTTSSGFTNAGTIELTNVAPSSFWGSTLTVNSGTLTNAAGAIIRSLAGGGGSRTLNAQLDNRGTMTLEHPLTISRASADHINSGLIDVSGGNLTLSQSGTSPSFTNTGTVTVAAGRTWSVTIGAFTQAAGGVLNGGGAVTLNSVSPAAFATAFTLGALTLSNTTASFATNLSNGTVDLTITNSTVNGPGTLTNPATRTLTLTGSDINTALTNEGLLVIKGFSSITGALTNAVDATVEIQGNGVQGGGTLTVASGFTNAGTIDLINVTPSSFWGSTLTVTSGTLTNASGASIRVLAGGGGSRNLNAQLANQGTVSIGHPLTISRASADHVNSGLIDISGGNLTLSQSGTSPSFTNTGTVTVAAGRTWTVTIGAFTQAAGGVLNGGGAITLNSVNPAAFETAFTLSALTLSNTTASFATTLSSDAVALTITNSTVNGPGTLTNPATRTLVLTGSDVNTAVVNSGLLVVRGSSAISGSLANEAGATLQVEGNGTQGTGMLTVSTGFTNAGTIELTNVASSSFWGSTLTVSSGTLTNASGATIRALAGGGGSRNLNAQLDNQGTISVGQPLTISRAGADHVNSGLIDVSGGNLTLSQSGTSPSFTNTGTVTVAAGRTWSITVGAFTQGTGATLNGGGTMTLSSVNPAAFGTAFTLSALSLSSTTASFATDLTTETLALTLFNSDVGGPGTITNAATKTLELRSTNINTGLTNRGVLLSTGGSSITGTFANETGATLKVEGNGVQGSSSLTVASGFTNNGAIELTNTSSTWSATLGVTAGTLTNAAGATISVLPGGGGSRFLNAQLDNEGTLALSHDLTITRGSAAHENSGTLTVSAGNLTINQSGTSPTFGNSGLIDLVGPGTMRVAGGSVSNAAGGEIRGAGTFEASTNTALSNSGAITAALVRIGGTLTSSAPGGFAPVTTDFIGSATLIPVGAGFAYTNIRTSGFAASITFGGALTVPGSLTAAGTSNLSIGANDITVNGDFTTTNTAVLTMTNAAGRLNVGGRATFGGGSTNGRLTAGVLAVAGNFVQQGNAAAFAASLGHVTVLNGTAAQSVSFLTPGSATTASHFQRLEIENASAGGVVLGSAVFANGQLRTPSGVDVERIINGSGFALTAGGLDAFGLVLDNTPLRVVNGEAITRFDDAVFRNMNPAISQFRLDRSSGAVTFNNTRFESLPSSGVYLHLVDTDAATALFTVTMVGTTPAGHGGFVIESQPGQLLGWTS